MTALRWCILFLGPIPIMWIALALTNWANEEPVFASSNEVIVEPTFRIPADETEDNDQQLNESLKEAARRLQSRLGDDCEVIMQSPFVIGGNLSKEQLQAWHDRTIYPASVALWDTYFEAQPDRPITVLLFTDRETYDDYADRLFGDRSISIYGYYKPSIRTLIMNIGTGGGTLVHELTHALIDFDFDAVPDWFNEGLASLHEQCRFRETAGKHWIEGLENWRLPALQKAIDQKQLGTLQEMCANPDFRGPNVGLNYAQARYFCMFMQQQGKLADFYQRFRKDHRRDASGAASIATVFPDKTWDELEADYRAWVMTLEFSR